jgi:hypothetical protein
MARRLSSSRRAEHSRNQRARRAKRPQRGDLANALPMRANCARFRRSGRPMARRGPFVEPLELARAEAVRGRTSSEALVFRCLERRTMEGTQGARRPRDRSSDDPTRHPRLRPCDHRVSRLADAAEATLRNLRASLTVCRSRHRRRRVRLPPIAVAPSTSMLAASGSAAETATTTRAYPPASPRPADTRAMVAGPTVRERSHALLRGGRTRDRGRAKPASDSRVRWRGGCLGTGGTERKTRPWEHFHMTTKGYEAVRSVPEAQPWRAQAHRVTGTMATTAPALVPGAKAGARTDRSRHSWTRGRRL